MTTNLTADIDSRVIEQITNANPLNKLLTPLEVAETVAYLITASEQINGVDLVLNGAVNIK